MNTSDDRLLAAITNLRNEVEALSDHIDRSNAISLRRWYVSLAVGAAISLVVVALIFSSLQLRVFQNNLKAEARARAAASCRAITLSTNALRDVIVLATTPSPDRELTPDQIERTNRFRDESLAILDEITCL